MPTNIILSLQKFLQSLDYVVTQGGCWILPDRNNEDYVRISYDGWIDYIHRLSAIAFKVVDIESSDKIKHNCGCKGCWNPAHLYVGPNMKCRLGHEMRVTPAGNKYCRECQKRRKKNQFLPSHVKYSHQSSPVHAVQVLISDEECYD